MFIHYIFSPPTSCFQLRAYKPNASHAIHLEIISSWDHEHVEPGSGIPTWLLKNRDMALITKWLVF
jgi:hypothetical protein